MQTSFTFFTFYTLLLIFIENVFCLWNKANYYSHKLFSNLVISHCLHRCTCKIKVFKKCPGLEPHHTLHLVYSYLYYCRRHRCCQWKGWWGYTGLGKSDAFLGTKMASWNSTKKSYRHSWQKQESTPPPWAYEITEIGRVEGI